MRTDGMPHAAATVVLVAVEGDTLGLIRETLAAEAVLPNSSVDFGEGIEVVARTIPDVILVGVDQDPDQAVEFARIMTKEAPQSTLVAISGKRDADLILREIRAGFREFIVLPDEAEQLRSAVHGAVFRASEDGEKGIVVALLGAKGGVGTTMLTTHLAVELSSIHRVLCIDGDFGTGDMAAMIDATPKDTLADILPRAEKVDERMLSSSVHVHASKVHYLCQPEDLDRIGELNPDEYYNVLIAAAKAYQYVLIDCGSAMSVGAQAALNIADQVVVIATPDVIAVRDAHRKIKSLSTLGVEKKRVGIVINQMPKQPYLSREAIENNLQVRILGTVAEDAKTAQQSINEGRLMRDVARRSPAALDIAKLVGVLAEDPDEVDATPQVQASGGLLARLFGR